MNPLNPKFTAIFAVLAACAVVAVVVVKKVRSPQVEEDEIQTNVAVETAAVQKQTLRHYLHLYGTVSADPGSESTPAASMQVTATADGLVEQVNCTEGQQVQKGDLLFSMDSRFAAAEVETATADAAFAENNFARQKALHSGGAASERTFLEAKRQFDQTQAALVRARTGLALTTVTAPFAGTVTGIKARAGETVGKGQPLCSLADLSRLVVVAKVPVREIGLLAKGQSVHVYENPGENAEALARNGSVSHINPHADPDSATVTIHCSLPSGNGLRAGQFVHIRVAIAEKENCLTVPVESIYTDYVGKSTLSVVEGDTARKVAVDTGFIENGRVEIHGEGMAEGMTVVTRGSYALPETTRITVKNPAQ